MKLGKILYHPQAICERVAELAEAISDDYDDLVAELAYDISCKDLVVIVILNGAMIFASDLIRQLSIPVELDTISLSSYKGTQSGKVRFNKDVSIDVTRRDILLIEDIIDTGQTMKYIFELFKERGAASVKLCSFLSKLNVRIPIDYLGFNIPDYFVVGYGLDYNEQYRQLPHIARLEKE